MCLPIILLGTNAPNSWLTDDLFSLRLAVGALNLKKISTPARPNLIIFMLEAVIFHL